MNNVAFFGEFNEKISVILSFIDILLMIVFQI
ncbi:MAG: hypothetical protein RL377_80 [Bacteroidota bacterium]